MCEAGESYRFEPDKIACPVLEQEDFILYTTRDSIRKFVFSNNKEEILPISGLVNAVSVEYDYQRDCVYWADAHIGKIQKLCLDGRSTVQVNVLSYLIPTGYFVLCGTLPIPT